MSSWPFQIDFALTPFPRRRRGFRCVSPRTVGTVRGLWRALTWVPEVDRWVPGTVTVPSTIDTARNLRSEPDSGHFFLGEGSRPTSS